MVYVASPYYDIVEDLLTALTGGVVREEATFSPDELEYYFGDSPVISESVRVVGIREKGIHHFITGQDFSADSEKITWGTEGDWPDNGSKFYINYYKINTEPVLSDRNVGSVTRTLAEAFAKELAVMSQQLLLVYDSGFLSTAKGDALDQVVAILGEKYARKSGDFATGDVLFFRNSPAPADIFINDGSLVSTSVSKTEEQIIYETVQEKTLRKGQVSILVPVRAIERGQAGVTEARTITIMVQPIMGIDGITNPREILPTGRDETDEELRERVKHALEAAGGTTTNAIKYALMSIPELSGVDIKVEEDFSQGNGLVRVYIDTEGTDDIVTKIDQKIFETKAAGIKVVHNLSKSEEGISGKLKMDLKEKTVALNVMVSLEDDSISSSEKENIRKNVSSEIETYFKELKIGESVLKNKLIALLFSVEGVKNIQIDFKDDQGKKLADEIKAESNEKISLLDGKLQILISGYSVFIDVNVQVLIVDKNLNKSIVEKSLTDKINLFINGVGKKLSVTDFSNSLKGNGYEVKKIAFDSEHLETGLIIHEITQGEEDIGDNEKFVLRKVNAEFL